MARSKNSHLSKRLRCERLEPRLVLSNGLGLAGLATEPLLHSPGTVRFDGVDDLLTFEDRPEMNTNEYTISLWFKADDLVGTQSLIARGEDWNQDKAQWVVELNDATHPGKIQLWYEEANDADHYFASQTTIEATVSLP